MLSSLLRWIRPRQAATTVRRRPSFRPALEILEDRLAPAFLTVNSVADNTTADNALTLREAIQVVNGTLGRSLSAAEASQVAGTLGTNDTVQFNLPAGPHTITLTGGALSLTRAVTINGTGAGELTISGNNTDRVFIVGQVWSRNLSLVVAINGLTIANGSALAGSNNYGGGLLNFGTLTVNNTTFANNAAGSSGGGGTYNVGVLTLNNCTFTGNSANGTTVSSSGGGIYNNSQGQLTVNNCMFSANAANGTGSGRSSGAGIANSGTLTVTGSTFTGNTATSNAGGINNSAGTLTVTATTFANNSATSGGGGLDSNGTLTISNCVFYGNTAGVEGGAIDLDSLASALITNTTLVGNTAGSRGGAINTTGALQLVNCTITGNRVLTTNTNGGGGLRLDYPALLRNTIVAGNFRGAAPSTTANDLAGTAASASAFNLIGTGGSAGLTNGVNGNQVGVSNPGLGVLADNGGPTQTIALLPGSTAIDQGSNAYVSAGVTDQRGFTRIVNGTVDIGAFEVQTVSLPATAFALSGFPSSLTAGAAGVFTVTALDGAGNIVTGYTGTVHFTSTDGQASLPANYTFTAADAGVHTFTATLKTAGVHALSVADAATGSITGTQSGITVNPAAASALVVTGFPAPVTAGAAGAFTVMAQDAFGNTASDYLGTVLFTSSDGQAVLPADYTFTSGDGGVHTFDATLTTAGSQSLTVTDTGAASITGTQAGITVTPAAAVAFIVAGFPSPTITGVAGAFTVTAKDAFANTATGYLGAVRVASSDEQALLPADYTFTSGDNGVHTFSATLNTAGSQSLTATDTTTPTITGIQAAITVNALTGALLTVNSVADGNVADSALTLREAILLVNGTLGRSLTAGEQAQVTGTLGIDDTIQFNVPAGPQTITLTGGALSITHAVTINGPGASALTVNGNGADRVFVVGQIFTRDLSLVVAISGLTISGGSQVYGGGLVNFGTLTLTNTTFANNSAGTTGGGGVYNVGVLTLDQCTFTGNTATGTATASSSGGALLNNSQGLLTINNCTFTSNAALGSGTGASSGGAIRNSGVMAVTLSTFTSNTATSSGGALYNTGALTVSSTTFSNNTSSATGGGVRSNGTLTLSGSTFAGNRASSDGGGLSSSDTQLTVTNCTFAYNVGSKGGGISIKSTAGAVTIRNTTITANRALSSSSGSGGGLRADVPVTLHNSIVAGNFRKAAPSTTADDIGGSLASSSSFNLIGTGGAGGLVNGVNNNLVGVSNPGLGTLTDNGGPTQTIALLPGSLAIDRGGNAYVSVGETDQRGQTRIVNGTVDIGAFEVQS